MPTLRSRPRRRQPVPGVQDRADLLALQWTHGIEVRLRPVSEDGSTDQVRAVVGEWLTRPGAGGPMPLAACRSWLRERLRASEGHPRGSARWAAAVDADELLVAVLASEDSGLVVTPLRRRLSA